MHVACRDGSVPATGVGRGEVLWRFQPCKDLDRRAPRLGQASPSGTVTPLPALAALAHVCQPQVCSSFTQAEL